MSYLVSNGAGSINLQSTLATSSAGLGAEVTPHNPITCTSELSLREDGTFACEHAQAPPADARTQACVDHSIALMLIELLREKENPDVVPG